MKTIVVTSRAGSGRWRTLSPNRRQSPVRTSVSSVGLWATVFCRGQKPRRPKIVSRAGSRVRPASSAQPTEIAATGPRVAVFWASASARTSIASATVVPEARIAGPERWTACAIASCLSSSRRSSSRYLDTSKRQ